MGSYVLPFQKISPSNLSDVGVKAFHLHELSKVDGVQVPEGFCVTTKAFQRIWQRSQHLSTLLHRLSSLRLEDQQQIREVSGKIRRAIQTVRMDKKIEEEITEALVTIGESYAYAVRSSSNVEDLPHTSFAGQQNTFLNVLGKRSIIRNITKCWASLFSERSVIYRIQNGFAHDQTTLAVIVQRLVFPDVSGVLFTADPMTSNRKVLSIDASFGLGEAIVDGFVNSDHYEVREGKIKLRKFKRKN